MLKKSDLRTIVHELEGVGYTDREAHLYIQSLQTGPASVQELANRLGQNRVTIHSASQQLIKSGLLYETRRGKRRLLVANDPEVLNQILLKRETELKLQKESLQSVTKLLQMIQPPDSHTPSVEFYEDVDGFKKMLERTLEVDAKGEFMAIVNAGLFSDLVGHEYLLDYFSRRAKKKIYSRLVFPNVEWAKVVTRRAKEFRIQVRILPDYMWPSGIFSWNNCLSLKSFTQNRLTCTIIENQDIATFFRTVIFELVWKQAVPVRL